MVYFKITNGVETRRFQVAPGEFTFQQLQERIHTLFPESTKEVSDLVLRYRDTEGDVITLSSDEEFQEVLSGLPQNHVWKLHITAPREKRDARPIRRGPFSELEELIDLLFGFHDSTPTKPEDKTTPTTEQPQGSEGTHPESADTQANAEGAPSDRASPKEGEDEEVKSKQDGGVEEPKSHPPTGHSHGVKRVALWDPFLFGGLFGPPSRVFGPPSRVFGPPSRVFGAPVGYHVTWTPRSCSSCSTGSAACA